MLHSASSSRLVGYHTHQHIASFHLYNIALKCKMQVASLAEPKTPLESSVFIIGFFVHTMKHCYATALYTTEASTIRYTCAYKLSRA